MQSISVVTLSLHQMSWFQDRIEVRVARIFNTFGPRMHMADGRVVSNFILQALQDEPITVSSSFLRRN